MNVFRLSMALLLMVTISATAQTTQSIDGAWSGQLDVGAMKLPVIFHIATSAAGLTATMDSPAQGASDIPTNGVTLDKDQLTIEVAKAHGRYSGTLSGDRDSITGTWSQGGAAFPLELKRTDDAALASQAPKRPQTPKPPFPYRSEAVTFTNHKAGDTLAGTLTRPNGPGPFPAVLLIAGSGPHDRDETIFAHKPFLVLADDLTRHGIAVLRVDKRGIGQSTGDYAKATSADFANDAEAALAFLHTRKDIDAHRIGLLGHSEGGLIAPMVASAEPNDVAFIVLLAGPGVSGRDIIVSQVKALSEAHGATAEQAQHGAQVQDELLNIVVSETDAQTRDGKLRAALLQKGVPEAKVDASVAQLTSPWYVSFLKADPARFLHDVRCPVLALAGSKDLQVLPEQNLAAIRAALAAAGNTHVQTFEFHDLNHLFQPTKTGLPSEYATIETTIDPAVLDKVRTWILAQPPR